MNTSMQKWRMSMNTRMMNITSMHMTSRSHRAHAIGTSISMPGCNTGMRIIRMHITSIGIEHLVDGVIDGVIEAVIDAVVNDEFDTEVDVDFLMLP